MDWKKLLRYIIGKSEQAVPFLYFVLSNLNPTMTALLLFQAAQIRMYKKRCGRLKLNREEKIELALLAKSIPYKILEKFAGAFHIKTYHLWFKNLVKFKHQSTCIQKRVGRPKKSEAIEKYVIRVCREQPTWGDAFIASNVTRLFEKTAPNTIRNIRRRNDIPPAPRRSTWGNFIKRNQHKTWACDFFTREIFNQYGLQTYYVLFFVHIARKQLILANATTNPTNEWVTQQAKNLVNIDEVIQGPGYLIRDNDQLWPGTFDKIFEASGIKIKRTAFHAPKMNAFAERTVRSIRQEIIGRHEIIFGEQKFRKMLSEYEKWYNHERPHQGIAGNIPLPWPNHDHKAGSINLRSRCEGRLGYYYRDAV